jgi:hypothetical protein
MGDIFFHALSSSTPPLLTLHREPPQPLYRVVRSRLPTPRWCFLIVHRPRRVLLAPCVGPAHASTFWHYA